MKTVLLSTASVSSLTDCVCLFINQLYIQFISYTQPQISNSFTCWKNHESWTWLMTKTVIQNWYTTIWLCGTLEVFCTLYTSDLRLSPQSAECRMFLLRKRSSIPDLLHHAGGREHAIRMQAAIDLVTKLISSVTSQHNTDLTWPLTWPDQFG